MYQLVVNVEEDVQGVHDRALASGRTGEIKGVGVGDAFVDPIMLSVLQL